MSKGPEVKIPAFAGTLYTAPGPYKEDTCQSECLLHGAGTFSWFGGFNAYICDRCEQGIMASYNEHRMEAFANTPGITVERCTFASETMTDADG